MKYECNALDVIRKNMQKSSMIYTKLEQSRHNKYAINFYKITNSTVFLDIKSIFTKNDRKESRSYSSSFINTRFIWQ